MFQKDLILKIKNLIALDKFDLAFDEMNRLINPEDQDELILLEGRSYRNDKSWHQNLIRLEDYQLERNRIGKSLLFFLKKITEENIGFDINLEKSKYLFNYGSILLVEKRYLDAINYFNEAILENPLDGDAHLERGAAKCSIGDYENALVDLSLAVKLRSQNPFAFYNRGIVFFELRQFKKALEDWKKVQGLGFDIADEFIDTCTKIIEEQ